MSNSNEYAIINPRPGQIADPGPAARPRLPLPVRLLLVVAGMFAAAFSSGLVFLIPGVSQAMETASARIQVVIMIAGWLVALLAYVAVGWLLTRFIDRRPFAEAGWRIDGRSGLALLGGTLAGAAIVMAASAILLPTKEVVPFPGPGELGWPLTVLFVLARSFALQGIGEELLWRGYALQTMRQRPVMAVLVSSLVFGVLHLTSSGGQQSLADHFWYLAMPLGFGFLAATLAVRSRSLWAAIGVHGGFHVGGAIADVLGWANTGPLYWVVVGALYVLVGLVVLATTPKPLLAAGSDRSPFDK